MFGKGCHSGGNDSKAMNVEGMPCKGDGHDKENVMLFARLSVRVNISVAPIKELFLEIEHTE